MPFIGLSRPKQQNVSPELYVGDQSPGDFHSNDNFTLVVFLRHIGCPFAEALIKELSVLADSRQNLRCIAICHGLHPVAQRWLSKFNLSDRIEVMVDTDRVLYGRWGVGYSGMAHLLSPGMLGSYAIQMIKGMRNRDASGTRWQKHAAFLVGPDNTIVWKYLPKHAGDLPDLARVAGLIPESS